MRATLIAVIVTILAFGTTMADPVAYHPAAFPRDEASLRDLDSRQLRIVRRAGAQCWHSGEGGFRSPSARSRGCVISTTESAMRSSDSPALLAGLSPGAAVQRAV